MAFWKSLANGWVLLLIAPVTGCAGGPRDFRKIDSKAPLVRARAVSLGTDKPNEKVIPKLVKHLDDSDPVVRLAAYQELHRRTGNDFGFVPWDEPQNRQSAVERWRAWIKQGMPRQPRAPAVTPSSQTEAARPIDRITTPAPPSQIPPPVTQSVAPYRN